VQVEGEEECFDDGKYCVIEHGSCYGKYCVIEHGSCCGKYCVIERGSRCGKYCDIEHGSRCGKGYGIERGSGCDEGGIECDRSSTAAAATSDDSSSETEQTMRFGLRVKRLLQLPKLKIAQEFIRLTDEVTANHRELEALKDQLVALKDQLHDLSGLATHTARDVLELNNNTHDGLTMLSSRMLSVENRLGEEPLFSP
jgi:hypothetical protein